MKQNTFNDLCIVIGSFILLLVLGLDIYVMAAPFDNFALGIVGGFVIYLAHMIGTVLSRKN